MGATASTLGSLNASHASATAFGHASPNSVVGQLSAYAQALNAPNPDIAAAAMALAQAAHSPAPIAASTVTAINTNLNNSGVLGANGFSFGNTNAQAIADQANSDR